MTDKRKLAVSYGSFSCVIEGFDDPFTLMRDIISFYYQVSEEEPGFAHFHEIVDMEELKAVLARDMGEDIELEPIAGGVYARRIETPARLAGAAVPADEATDEDGDAEDRRIALVGGGMAATSTETEDGDAGAADAGGQGDATEDETEPDAYPEDAYLDEAYSDGAFSDDDYAAEGGWQDDPSDDDDTELEADHGDTGDGAGDSTGEAPGIAAVPDEEDDRTETLEDDTDEAAAEERDDAHSAMQRGWDDAEDADEQLSADEEDGDLAADEDILADEATDEDIAEDEDGSEQAENAPIRLYGAMDGGRAERSGAADDEDADDDRDDAAAREPAASGPGPIRLSNALRAGGDEPGSDGSENDDAENDDAEKASPHDRLTLSAALRLGPRDAVGADDAPADDDDAEQDEPAASAFIDRVAEKDETRDLLSSPTPHRLRPAHEDDTPIDVSIAQIRSDIAAAEEETKPKRSGGLMGNLLRRKSAAPDDAGTDAAPEAEDSEAPEAAASAEKPRSLSGGRLRVIRSGEEDRGAGESDAEPKPDRRVAEAPERRPEPEPAPEPARRSMFEVPDPGPTEAEEEDAIEPTPARAERDTGRGADPLASRLHASFDSKPAPSSSKDMIDLTIGEMQDPYSPRGFAQRVGAGSASELIAAAAAFRILVDGKTSVTRTDIMETVQMIMGDKPLSAEAKVKAFGKLVRAGDLIRIDGGEFSLSPEQIDSYQQRFEAARANAAGG